jgi:S1-C subfamily serine protease
VGGTTACLVVALVAAGMVLAATATSDQAVPGSRPGAASLTAAPTTEVSVGSAVGAASLAAMVASVSQSTVVIKIEKSAGSSVSTGLVAESGGIIVMAAGVLVGAKTITAIEPSGSHQVADLIGVDQTSGLAVVRIPDDLPAATFDSGDPTNGAVIYAVAMEPRPQVNVGPIPVVYAGKVISAGQSLASDPVTTTFAATAIEAPLAHDDLGCPLLDSAGHVSGMLEGTVQDGASTVSVFLPAELVLGVTRQLVSSGKVVHGWMGAHTSDTGPGTTTSGNAGAGSAPAAPGAQIDSVAPGSPAATVMMPGDVITAIDGNRVQSSAELLTRLYPDPPGTSLEVTFTRGGTSLRQQVVLASSDTDASGGHTSP